MNSNGLEQWQVQRLLDHVKREERYLDCLEGRMHQKHFPMNDPLYQTVKNARRTMVALKERLEGLLKAE